MPKVKQVPAVSKRVKESGFPQCFELTKAQARLLALGDQVTLTVKGCVKAVRENEFAGKDMYSIDVSDADVTHVEVNRADTTFRKMVGEAKSVGGEAAGGPGRSRNDADKSLGDMKRGAVRSY